MFANGPVAKSARFLYICIEQYIGYRIKRETAVL